MSKRAGAERICQRLEAAGHRALFAGGCVRDLLLDQTPKDYDIATSARPEEVARLFDKTVPVGVEFGTQLVVEPEGEFEVTTFRQDGPYVDGRHPAEVWFTGSEEDARRRDFTVNALYYDPLKEEVVDYVGGQGDLQAGVIRTVGPPQERLAEDYLRLLRAVRFAARLGYRIDKATFEAMVELAHHVVETSAERIRDELVKMLTEGASARAFQLLDETGLLDHVLPEISAMKGVEQPAAFHPEGDVFKHTLLCLKELDRLAHRTATLAFGVLLHDVGKPVTQTFEDRIRFNHHDKVGAEMARDICDRLRMPKRDISRIAWLVAEHMRVSAIPDMRESKRKRFVREDGFDELLALARIDCLASHGDLSEVEWIESYIANLKPEEVKPSPLLTGKELIAMGYTPGPQFGAILSEVEDGQLEEWLKSPEEARDYVLRRWPVQ
ncbi:MAG: CCA tRNA nucleotidyltransferase [Candidatus Hydrogenedentota bacterium]